MADEIGFENGRNSNFEGLVTLTLDPAIRHTVVHHTHRPLPIYQISFKSKKLFVDGRTDIFPPILLGRLLEVDLTIIYAVQNDTEIKFNIVLYIKVIFLGQGVGIKKAYNHKAQIIVMIS